MAHNNARHRQHQVGAAADPSLYVGSGVEYSVGSGRSSSTDGANLANSPMQMHTGTAEDWFASLNSDVGGNPNYYDSRLQCSTRSGGGSDQFMLDESPYYMPNHHHKRKQQPGVRNVRPLNQYHGGFSASTGTFNQLPAQVQPESAEESNSESFRSVIDDLTVKSMIPSPPAHCNSSNSFTLDQKLKRKLRKYEGLHGAANRTADRLFEVRVHDLPE